MYSDSDREDSPSPPRRVSLNERFSAVKKSKPKKTAESDQSDDEEIVRPFQKVTRVQRNAIKSVRTTPAQQQERFREKQEALNRDQRQTRQTAIAQRRGPVVLRRDEEDVHRGEFDPATGHQRRRPIVITQKGEVHQAPQQHPAFRNHSVHMMPPAHHFQQIQHFPRQPPHQAPSHPAFAPHGYPPQGAILGRYPQHPPHAFVGGHFAAGGARSGSVRGAFRGIGPGRPGRGGLGPGRGGIARGGMVRGPVNFRSLDDEMDAYNSQRAGKPNAAGRGRGAGGRVQGRRAGGGASVSQAELDAEMDEYMKARQVKTAQVRSEGAYTGQPDPLPADDDIGDIGVLEG
mmetsp:Transcript_50643/g.99175  ORF Transcript_50643/g.99175 Transcript_50643/m.99175 type:complete len:345 (-) Transcript_50643:122-1156(-)|eukprot:CAMPEP_0175135208 /NCGR_PEP_ID=MMETSP0087-20121206/8594_1 /TAXON_ID=136419 /ORGANISM="Unknown Unknown, Strain D1" /LENGTH=344 /DNA_ID=CAMNT_0016417831 /DNA_START=30 /DNA_END=1064 /DNA_ORIENTATION=+